nr:autoinducer binding domain-containing protein [Marinicella sp. W31]MDC2878455.1 autoinducer binding domain-containing protein [Marinicella sp. W31]
MNCSPRYQQSSSRNLDLFSNMFPFSGSQYVPCRRKNQSRFTWAFDKASQVESLSRLLSPIATEFKFSHFALVEYPWAETEAPDCAIHCTTLPPSFVEASERAGLLRMSSQANTHGRAAAPLQWTLADIEDPHDSGRADLAELMRTMHISMGVVFAFAPNARKPLSLLFLAIASRSTEQKNMHSPVSRG